MKNKKIIIVVPDGVGIRNYLFSSFTNKLFKSNIDIVIYHKISMKAIKEIKNHKPFITSFFEIPDFIESPKVRLLRELLANARLRIYKKILKNETILDFWSPKKKGFKKKILYFLAESLGFIFSTSYRLILFGDKLFEKALSKDKQTLFFKEKLKLEQPDFILNLHQRSPFSSPIITAADTLDLKTATVIFSWDNIPKSRLISRYDYYFVWSELMKNQLLKLYPEIENKQVKITGSPQFEFYFNDDYKLDKKVFFDMYNLNINKKTICFSGGDNYTAPHDQNYLEDLCESLETIDETQRPQVIFRRCPVDFSDRFDFILQKYPKTIIQINPDWNTKDTESRDKFISVYPKYNDIHLLVNTCLHSDIVINLGSTMAHDFAVFDKPCLYVNYNPVKDYKRSVSKIYNFEHFRSLKNLDAVGWVNSKEELLGKIKEALNNPEKIAVDRKKWLDKIILHPLENNSTLLKKEIEKCM